jgi:hypothetical protein
MAAWRFYGTGDLQEGSEENDERCGNKSARNLHSIEASRFVADVFIPALERIRQAGMGDRNISEY